MTPRTPMSSHDLMQLLLRNRSVELVNYEIRYWTKVTGKRPRLILLAPEHAARVRTHTDAKTVFGGTAGGMTTLLGIPVKVWKFEFSSVMLFDGRSEIII